MRNVRRSPLLNYFICNIYNNAVRLFDRTLVKFLICYRNASVFYSNNYSTTFCGIYAAAYDAKAGRSQLDIHRNRVARNASFRRGICLRV